MPKEYVKKVGRETGIGTNKAESEWKEAKKNAAEQGKGDNYGYITQIFKNRTGASCIRLNAKQRLLADPHRDALRDELSMLMDASHQTYSAIEHQLKQGLSHLTEVARRLNLDTKHADQAYIQIEKIVDGLCNTYINEINKKV